MVDFKVDIKDFKFGAELGRVAMDVPMTLSHDSLSTNPLLTDAEKAQFKAANSSDKITKTLSSTTFRVSATWLPLEFSPFKDQSGPGATLRVGPTVQLGGQALQDGGATFGLGAVADLEFSPFDAKKPFETGWHMYLKGTLDYHGINGKAEAFGATDLVDLDGSAWTFAPQLGVSKDVIDIAGFRLSANAGVGANFVMTGNAGPANLIGGDPSWNITGGLQVQAVDEPPAPLPEPAPSAAPRTPRRAKAKAKTAQKSVPATPTQPPAAPASSRGVAPTAGAPMTPARQSTPANPKSVP